MKRKAETQLESEEQKKLPTEENQEEPSENTSASTEKTEEKKEEITPSTNTSTFSFFNLPTNNTFSLFPTSSEQKDSTSSSSFVSPFSATSSPFSFTSNFATGENPFGNFKFSSFTSSSENGENATAFPTFTPASIESSDTAPTLQQAVNVLTGEEDEYQVYTIKAKVFRFLSPKWRERGQGLLKVNVSKTTNKSRIVMRNDKTLQLILNVPLLKECRVKKFSEKDIQLFSVDLSEGPSNPNYSPILIRVKSASECSDLYAAITSKIPEFVEGTEEQKPKEKKTEEPKSESKSEESTPVNTSESKEETPSTTVAQTTSDDPTDF